MNMKRSGVVLVAVTPFRRSRTGVLSLASRRRSTTAQTRGSCGAAEVGKDREKRFQRWTIVGVLYAARHGSKPAVMCEGM